MVIHVQDGMDQIASSRDFGGVVLVARNGHVLFQEAYGLANREHDAYQSGAKFRVGLAILRAVGRDNRLPVDRAYADKLPFLLND